MHNDKLGINECICVLNKVISIGADENESQVLIAPNFFEKTCVFKKRQDSKHHDIVKIKRVPLLCLGNAP